LNNFLKDHKIDKGKPYTHTSIKTCVLYFIKKQEGKEILKVDIKYTKTNKESKRTYTFSNTHQTSSVTFSMYNSNTDDKTILIEVPIETIAHNKYSLNFNFFRYFTIHSKKKNFGPYYHSVKSLTFVTGIGDSDTEKK
jgi:hypothetical protein